MLLVVGLNREVRSGKNSAERLMILWAAARSVIYHSIGGCAGITSNRMFDAHRNELRYRLKIHINQLNYD